jgi:hypothetical protein
MFSFIWNYQTVFHCGCTILCFYQQSMIYQSVSWHPCLYLVLPQFFILAILSRGLVERWSFFPCAYLLLYSLHSNICSCLLSTWIIGFCLSVCLPSYLSGGTGFELRALRCQALTLPESFCQLFFFFFLLLLFYSFEIGSRELFP